MPITDRDSAEEWLQGKPLDKNVAFAARAALRAFPGIASADDEALEKIVLPVMRAILTTSVASMLPHSEVRSSASTASQEATSIFNLIVVEAVIEAAAGSADFAAHSAASEKPTAGSAAANAARSAAEIFRTDLSRQSFWSEMDRDASQLEVGVAASIFDKLLWSELAAKDAPGQRLTRLREFWQKKAEIWGFWDRWYEGMLNGTPMEWALQREVALIPNEDWEKGPRHVANLIEEIERQYQETLDANAVDDERALSGHALKRHVQKLLEQSAATEFNAVGLAWQIKSAIDAYCNACGDNETPEELLSFEAIAKVLSRIGGTLAEARIGEENKDKIADQLEAQIAELQLRIKALERELAESKSKEITGLIRRGFYQGISTSLAFACTTSVVSAATYFIAPELAPEIVRHLGNRFMDQFEKPSLFFPQIGVN